MLINAGTQTKYPPQRRIISQGDDSEHALLLLGGYVKVLASAEGGYEALLGIRVGGDIVGEMAAIDGSRRSATVLACGQVSGRLIRRAELIDLLRRYADLHVEVTRMLSERLRYANRRRIDFRAHSAQTRVGRVLVELAERYGHQQAGGRVITVRITQSELASLAGVSLTTVEKAIHALHDAEILDRRSRQLIVTDLEQLRTVTKMTERNPY